MPHSIITPQPRVLHLSERAFWCGESNRVRVLCQGLHQNGWPVWLGAPASSALARVAAEKGLPLDTRFAFRHGFRPGAYGHDIRLLRKFQREHAVDIIHVHTSVDTWVAALAFGWQRHRRRPLLVRTRHSDHRASHDPIHRWLYRDAIDHLVLSSASLTEPLAGLISAGALTPERMTVIHSSVDVDRFDPQNVSGDAIRREWNLSDRFCIGLIGRVSEEKGHDLLLTALPALIKKTPNVCAVLVGTGPAEAALRATVQQRQLDAHVHFAGFRNDIPAIVAAMDLLVVPSRRVESSPGVVKEGMAMCKPVIAADVGGVREIIDDRVNGWIIPRNDSQALESAVEQLIADAPLRARMGTAARDRMVTQFSDSRLVEQTQQLYKRLLEQDV